MIGFLFSKVGLAVIVGLAVAVALAWFYLDAKQAGAASVIAAAAAEAARRVQAANKARNTVNPSQDAIDADRYNRDRR